MKRLLGRRSDYLPVGDTNYRNIGVGQSGYLCAAASADRL